MGGPGRTSLEMVHSSPACLLSPIHPPHGSGSGSTAEPPWRRRAPPAAAKAEAAALHMPLRTTLRATHNAAASLVHGGSDGGGSIRGGGGGAGGPPSITHAYGGGIGDDGDSYVLNGTIGGGSAMSYRGNFPEIVLRKDRSLEHAAFPVETLAPPVSNMPWPCVRRRHRRRRRRRRAHRRTGLQADPAAAVLEVDPRRAHHAKRGPKCATGARARAVPPRQMCSRVVRVFTRVVGVAPHAHAHRRCTHTACTQTWGCHKAVAASAATAVAAAASACAVTTPCTATFHQLCPRAPLRKLHRTPMRRRQFPARACPPRAPSASPRRHGHGSSRRAPFGRRSHPWMPQRQSRPRVRAN